MRIALTAVIALAALSSPLSSRAQQPTAPAIAGNTVSVRLSNFAFEPDHLRLKAGVPVRLRLVNDSNGAHDFSAPAFFAASNVLPGPSAPSNGAISVRSHQTAEIAVVPQMPGTYRVECTHFLHSFFGMHGTVEVTPP